MKKHLLCLNLLFAFSSSVMAQFSSLVANVEKAVFQIQTYNEFGLNEGSGTGFFIDSKGTGLTAHHVLEESSPMKMGNIKSFKLIFDRIPELTTFDLKEGMPGGDWSFNQVSLPQKQLLTKDIFENFIKEHLFLTAFDIKYERYEAAIDSLQKYRHLFPANEKLERFSAIAYFENKDYDSSAACLERALVYLPEQNSLYADLYEVEMKRGNTEKALEAIEKAIELEPTYIEYYLFRARAHEKMQNWAAAIVDYNRFIDSGRDPVASIYFARGMAKARIKDPGACGDIDKAKELADSDREWDRYQKAFREFCR